MTMIMMTISNDNEDKADKNDDWTRTLTCPSNHLRTENPKNAHASHMVAKLTSPLLLPSPTSRTGDNLHPSSSTSSCLNIVSFDILANIRTTIAGVSSRSRSLWSTRLLWTSASHRLRLRHRIFNLISFMVAPRDDIFQHHRVYATKFQHLIFTQAPRT